MGENSTKRRCLVEQIRSVTEKDNIGDFDVTTVYYCYDKDWESNAPFGQEPISVKIIDADEATSFAQGRRVKSFTKLQLEAHIKNPKTILVGLE